jgi:hypothetical protein
LIGSLPLGFAQPLVFLVLDMIDVLCLFLMLFAV